MKLALPAFAAVLAFAPVAVQAQDAHQGHAPATPPAQEPTPQMDHSQMDHSQMDHSQMDHGQDEEDAHDMAAMNGVLGSYPMSRDASGTSWQPDLSTHDGVHAMRGAWSVMAHAVFNGVYDRQDGPRGDDRTFVSGMVMLSARRDFANMDSLQLRAMLSPDPFMGRSGYPLLLAAGESADGVTPLVDRQHPHDLFMELSASYTHRLSDQDSLFVYAGLPGEPAFGPPAFMHRASIMDSPEAPISHHWLDSTHIVFGVVTVGWVHGAWKLEASAFKGRESDERRYDIEAPKLDSTAVRISWNPTERWSLQASWADQTSPEALEPDDDQTRWSASAIYTAPFGADGRWSATGAWGRKLSHHGDPIDAFVLEASLKPNDRWSLFSRGERIETDELGLPVGSHGPVRTVAKVSIGVVRDWAVAEHVKVGLGGLYAFNFVPDALEPSYGGDPGGGMVFVRLKVE